MTATADGFRLSRIYAQGWNTARAAGAPDRGDGANPYASEPERSRWNAGFADAQADTAKGSR
jgi:hypothetical protein